MNIQESMEMHFQAIAISDKMHGTKSHRRHQKYLFVTSLKFLNLGRVFNLHFLG